MSKLAAGVFAACVAAFANQALAQPTLTIWWEKGFYQAEDEALAATIRRFEDKTGAKVELSQYPAQQMIPRTLAALESGVVPDIAYADAYDFQVTSKWAFDGRLENLSDILTPLKASFLPNTVETTYLYNDRTKGRAYYAFPVKQQTLHVEYWLDMLADAGFSQSDIPTGWKEYWSFWCDKAQPAARRKTGRHLYGIGQPMGIDSSDSIYSFLMFADAYNVKLIDDNGKLLVDDPKMKQGLVDALTDYTAVYAKGCSPPSSTSWKDPDNNVAFNNRATLMTHNATIAIPAKWLDDANSETLSAAQRERAKKNYQLIRTAGFPDKPDGSKMVYRAAVKTGVIFADARNKKLAKEFVAFLLQEENLTPYVEGALGRWYPVMKAAAERPFWKADEHRAAVYDEFHAGTVPFEFTRNYRFTILNNENIWARAMSRVVNGKVPVDKAVDEMIARIKAVAGP